MKSNYNYKFYGNFNSIIRYDFILFLSLIGALIFGLLITFFSVYLILGLILLICLIVYVLIKFDSESNLILFDVDRMIRLNKNKVTEISYNEILKLEFIYQPKGQSFSKLTLSNQVLKFTLENK